MNVIIAQFRRRKQVEIEAFAYGFIGGKLDIKHPGFIVGPGIDGGKFCGSGRARKIDLIQQVAVILRRIHAHGEGIEIDILRIFHAPGQAARAEDVLVGGGHQHGNGGGGADLKRRVGWNDMVFIEYGCRINAVGLSANSQ